MNMKNKIKNYLCRTWKLKAMGIGMIALGYLSTLILEDGGAFVLFLFFGMPLLFMDEGEEA